MLYKAQHRFARIASTKVRPWADLIRGRSAADGLNALRYVPNRGARMVEKVLRSAMANAEDRGARNVDGMRIGEARVDDGPMFKRMMPRARGMSYIIRRRFAHIHVGIEGPDAI